MLVGSPRPSDLYVSGCRRTRTAWMTAALQLTHILRPSISSGFECNPSKHLVFYLLPLCIVTAVSKQRLVHWQLFLPPSWQLACSFDFRIKVSVVQYNGLMKHGSLKTDFVNSLEYSTEGKSDVPLVACAHVLSIKVYPLNLERGFPN
jgi:hypothetical protein